MLTFTPEEQIKYIPFEVINDSIAEKRESFCIFLTVPMNPELYYLGTIQTAVIYIDDDEGKPKYKILYSYGDVEAFIKIATHEEISG